MSKLDLGTAIKLLRWGVRQNQSADPEYHHLSGDLESAIRILEAAQGVDAEAAGALMNRLYGEHQGRLSLSEQATLTKIEALLDAIGGGK